MMASPDSGEVFMLTTRVLAACAATVVLTAVAEAGPSPEAVCQSGKLKATGAYSACRLKADAVAAIKGTVADYAKCASKFSVKFPAHETKAGPNVCPTEGDVSDIDDFVGDCEHALDLVLDGNAGSPSVCGDGLRDTGEACDRSDLGGKSCASLGATDFTGLACTDACRFDFSGCQYTSIPATRYNDLGDGTIVDTWSGLMWEKKTGTPGSFVVCNTPGACPDLHDVNNSYAWSGAVPAFDGPVLTNFLDLLNDVAGGGASCFAGYCDWRLPTTLELRVLLQDDGWTGSCLVTPCVDPAFPGLTGSGGYWSAMTNGGDPNSAWWVRFDGGGGLFTTFKGSSRYARAVRSAL